MDTQNVQEAVGDASRETARLEAFSDGVFAIAITLLALEVRVPSHETVEQAGGLLRALGNLWPSYFAFVTSFITILIMWVNHHRMYRMIPRVDHVSMIFNGLLLMGISLVPFTSALLAEYIDDVENAKIGALIYAGVFVGIALFFNALWRYAAHKRRLLDPKIPQDWLDAINRSYRFGPLLYLVAALLALVHVVLSVAVVFGLAVFYALPTRPGEITRV